MGNKNRWFKHYNNAHEDQKLVQLWAERKYEVIAFYWFVLELVSKYEDHNNRGVLVGRLSLFKHHLGMNSNKSLRLLRQICTTFELVLTEKLDKSFELSIPNWLKLQETRGGKREVFAEPLLDRHKTKDIRRKNIVVNNTTNLINIWNENRGSLPECKSPSASRLRQVAARLRDNPDPEYWVSVVKRIAASDFCSGRSPGSSWVATFDWLIKPDTHIKVSEGKYDNRGAPKEKLEYVKL